MVIRFGRCNIRPHRADAVVVEVQRHKIVVFVVAQTVGIGNSAARNNARNASVYNSLYYVRRVLHLFANRYFIPFFKQSRNIRLNGMMRHAAHGRAFAHAARSAGKR